MTDVVISATGIYHPEDSVDNDQLVEAFNKYVDIFNAENQSDIDAGLTAPKQYSSSSFIEKASGIKKRYIVEASGVLDENRMASHLPEDAFGDDENPSMQARWAIEAATQALDKAGLTGADIDLVICSAAVLQRYFPAIAIEVQKHLGTRGAAYDMVAGCSSATFGMINGMAAIKAGMAKRVLMINPEIFTTMVNYRDRDSHFIFGDICTAVVLERSDIAKGENLWKILDTKMQTRFSSNIRSEFSPLTRFVEDGLTRSDMYFVQEGRKVFKELLPLVCDFVETQLDENSMSVADFSRMWLHQANINMNMYAAKKLLGREPSPGEAPVVLDEYGNTAGAGSVLAFHLHSSDLVAGDKGIICSFGAGYSIGSLIVEKL